MQTKEQIYSLKIERHVLGGLINNPQTFPEIERFITEKDFFNDINSTIFCVIRSILANNQPLDKVLIAEKIHNLQIKFQEPLDIYRYIDDISFTQITSKAVVESSRELLKYRIRREILDTAREIAEFAKKCGTKDIDEIISTCDKKYSSKMAEYSIEDEPIKLFEGIEELVEERGNNPQEDSGLITPYKEFNDIYGGLRAGNVYAICSRPGQGKTTWINDICFKVAQLNSIKVLTLDTEMETEDIQFRMAASITGVPMWHLETGSWRKNQI